MVKRKLAAHDNLKITLQQDGNTFHVKESSSFRTLEMDFTLGVTFDYSLADGTELSVSKHGLKTCCQGSEPTTTVVMSRGIAVCCRGLGEWRERC